MLKKGRVYEKLSPVVYNYLFAKADKGVMKSLAKIQEDYIGGFDNKGNYRSY